VTTARFDPAGLHFERFEGDGVAATALKKPIPTTIAMRPA
jgi:hypothetical protein